MAQPNDRSNDRPSVWNDPVPPEQPAIALSIGNTSARFGLIRGLGITHAAAVPANEPRRVVEGIESILAAIENAADHPETVLVSSVNSTEAPAVLAAVKSVTGLSVLPFGASMPVPLAMDVAEPAKVGQDRLLSALGAFSRLKQACIVVDAGTALTVDFVDGHGVFHGGAIIPGGQMMLRALHQQTAALPNLSLADMPEPLEPFGRSTEHAMLLGVRAALRGAVRYLAERYAIYYEAYPTIIATGGEAPVLAEGDELLELVVPDLQLLGIAVARARLAQDLDPDE